MAKKKSTGAKNEAVSTSIDHVRLKTLLQDKNFSTVISELSPHSDALKTEPELAITFARAVLGANDAGEMPQIAALILQHHSENARALSTANQLFTALNDLENASKTLEALLVCAPDDGKSRLKLVSIYHKLKNKTAARKHLKLTADQGGATSETLEKAKEWAMKYGDVPSMEAIGHAYVSVAPSEAAECASWLLENEAEDAAAEITAKLDATYRTGFLGQPLTRALKYKLQRLRTASASPESLRTPLALLSLEPGDVDATNAIGRIAKDLRAAARELKAAGNLEGALDMLAKAQTYVSDNAIINREYALFAEQAGDLNGAFKAWLALLPEDDSLFDRVYNAGRKAGVWDQLLPLLAARLKANPKDPELSLMMGTGVRRAVLQGRAHFEAAEYDEALKFAKTVLAVDAENVAAVSLLRKMKKALRETLKVTPENGVVAKQLHAVDPEDVSALKSLARMAEQAKNRLEAAQYWQKLAEGPKSQASYWEKASKLYAKAGHSDLAEMALAKAS